MKNHEEYYTKAIELLYKASTPNGFVAAVQEHDNYKRIWTRDGVICGLAALLSGEEKLILTFRDTLRTIFTHQHQAGFIPSNVSEDGSVSYGGSVGRADNPSWAVIGLCQYSIFKNDFSLAEEFHEAVAKCMAVMEAWEYNGKDLIYVPQSGDWADEYFHHGYILFDQLLRVWALRLASRVYKRHEWKTKAEKITGIIRLNFRSDTESGNHYSPALMRMMPGAPNAYWLMGFNPSRLYTQFDLQANSLCLLLNIGTHKQNNLLLTHLEKMTAEYGTLLPSFYPPVNEEDNDMAELSGNYAYTFRNKPNEFHNGGLWPVWNGWLVAALAGNGRINMAARINQALHTVNSKRQWEFNECLRGNTGEPTGISQCTWSAAGAVIAEKSLEQVFLVYE